MPRTPACLRYAIVRLGGKVLASVPINHVVRGAEGSERFYLKRRRWYTPGLIFAAEALLPARFHVLPEEDWLVWEPAIYQLAHGIDVRVGEAGQLKLPELPGVVLDDLLRASDVDVEQKLLGLTAALKSLQRLHRLWVRFPDGVEGYFSHGDATVRNVIFDRFSGAAQWFDFETGHRSWQPRAWRQADDLRALTCSAAAILPEGELPQVARLLAATYQDGAVLQALRRSVAEVARRPTLDHLAQADISYGKSRRWVELLTAVLAAQ